MGLFHDTCEAIVDLKTGDALSGDVLDRAREVIFPINPETGLRLAPLTGEARLKALQEHGWGLCGHSVPKRARVCAKCGAPSPKGWVKCPSCRKWIPNDSRFCPRCNHPLHPEERVDFPGGVWDREPGAFAQRFEIDDVAGMKKSGVKIQEGTLAILLDAGKKTSILGPGRHSPEGTLRTINWFGNPPPRSLVMVDAGDCVFRVEFADLRTAEEMAVSVVAEVTLRFSPGEADAFLANILKGSRKIGASDMCAWLVSEATVGVRNLCNESNLEDLVKDPDCRTRFEDAIRRALTDLLKRSGLELVRVGYVDFISPAYEKLRRQLGELEEKRREVEFARKEREFLAEAANDEAQAALAQKRAKREAEWQDAVIEADAERRQLDAEEIRRRDAVRRQQETEEYLEQLAQEKGLSAVSRETEMQLARLAANGEISRKEAEEKLAEITRAHEQELAEYRNAVAVNEITRSEEMKNRQHEAALNAVSRDEKLRDAQADSTVSRLKTDDEVYAARQQQELAQAGMESQLKALERIKAMEAKERADAAAAELARLQAMQEMSADQILALQAGESEAAAGAIAARANAEATRNKELLEEVRRQAADRQAHDELTMRMIHDLASKAIEKPAAPVPPAQGQAPAINIVK